MSTGPISQPVRSVERKLTGRASISPSLLAPAVRLGLWLKATTYTGLTRGNAISRANLSGSSVNQSFISTPTPVGLAVAGSHIYWTNGFSDAIGRAFFNGTSVNPSFITGADVASGLAIVHNYIYWGNQYGNTIGRADLDGNPASVDESFITGANSPAGLTIGTLYIYWANYGGSTIGRPKVDGQDVSQSFIAGVPRRSVSGSTSTPTMPSTSTGPAPGQTRSVALDLKSGPKTAAVGLGLVNGNSLSRRHCISEPQTRGVIATPRTHRAGCKPPLQPTLPSGAVTGRLGDRERRPNHERHRGSTNPAKTGRHGANRPGSQEVRGFESHYLHRCCRKDNVFPGQRRVFIGISQPGQKPMFESSPPLRFFLVRVVRWKPVADSPISCSRRSGTNPGT